MCVSIAGNPYWAEWAHVHNREFISVPWVIGHRFFLGISVLKCNTDMLQGEQTRSHPILVN